MKLIAVLALCFLFVSQIYPQSTDSSIAIPPVKEPRFHFTASGIYAMLETNLRFELPNGLLGVKINFEDHLGLEKYKMMPVFTGKINIKNRHNIFAMYYFLGRSSHFELQKEIEFNDQIFNINTVIDGYFNLNTVSLGYMYDVVKDSKSHLGLFLNLYMLSLKTGISVDQTNLRESFWVYAPFPNVGAQTEFKINERFGLSGLFSIFFLSMNGYSGAIHTVNGQMDFSLTNWLDLAIGYYWFDLNLEAQKTSFTGILDYTYQGPYLEMGFRF